MLVLVIMLSNTIERNSSTPLLADIVNEMTSRLEARDSSKKEPKNDTPLHGG